jgi:tRNA pseudouridine32 synthase/23S rRNA pseudouridine746 synthase
MNGPSRAPAPSFVTLPQLDEPTPTVFEFLLRRFPHVGEAEWRARVADGSVRFDAGEDGGGEAVTLATPYRAGARVRYYRAVADEPAVPFVEEVLHRDERLLVADKPHFLPVTPGGPYVNECLLYRLRRRTGLPHLQPVHRLDRDTAGVVLFAVDADSRGLYGRLFQEGRVEKEYLAVARLRREPDRRAWRVEDRIVRGEPWFRMRTAPGAANAVTEIELLDHRRDPEDGELGLFRLRPRTGKKHQLRLHLASLGFPILHDRYYPDLQPESPPDFERPLQLLASALSFRDPTDGRRRRFASRLRLLRPIHRSPLFSPGSARR